MKISLPRLAVLVLALVLIAFGAVLFGNDFTYTGVGVSYIGCMVIFLLWWTGIHGLPTEHAESPRRITVESCSTQPMGDMRTSR